jgi:hypothetical protein
MASAAAQSHIAATIKELNECPESVKQLLLMALPNAFGPDLHPYQKEAAAMLRKSLEDARTTGAEAQTSSSQRVKEAETILETLKADAESTTGAEEAARVVLSEKKTALESAEAIVKKEELICEEAKIAKAYIDEERQKLESAKAEVESVQNGSFRMLLDGGWDEEEVRDVCIEGVCEYLNNVGADAVLLAALPKALKFRPAECAGFDKIVVDEALSAISAKVAECTAQLAQGEEHFEDGNAEYMGACAILDLARETVQAASKACDDAETALQSATVDKKLALSKVLDQDSVLANLLAESTLVDARVQQVEQALQAFALLEAGDDGDKENVMQTASDCKAIAMDVDQVQVGITA